MPFATTPAIPTAPLPERNPTMAYASLPSPQLTAAERDDIVTKLGGEDADNKADMYAKGRHSHGERHWLSKVTHCPQGHPYSGYNLYIRKCGTASPLSI